MFKDLRSLGRRPLAGALARLLRLKGFAWLATQPNQQMHAALAGTKFTMVPGPPWWWAVPPHMWPEGLAEKLTSDQARSRAHALRAAMDGGDARQRAPIRAGQPECPL